jgi:hypothetical protein
MLATADTLIAHRPKRASTHTFRAELFSKLQRGAEAIAAARHGVALSHPDSSGWAWTVFHDVSAKHGTAAQETAAFEGMLSAGGGQLRLVQ